MAENRARCIQHSAQCLKVQLNPSIFEKVEVKGQVRRGCGYKVVVGVPKLFHLPLIFWDRILYSCADVLRIV